MKQSCIRLLTVIAVWLVALPAARAQGVTIKLTTLAPLGSSWHLTLKEMGEAWKKASNGRVTLKIYAGGVAGDEAAMVRRMRFDPVYAAAVTGTGLSEIDRGVQALQVPMLYRSDAELDFVREKLAPKLEARLREKGFVVLTWGEAGWVHFFTKTPVVTPDDLKKLKLFTWAGDTLVLDLWKDGGFHPVPLASTDILPSLQTGMINAFATPPVAALSFQWYTHAPNMTDLRWAPLIGATVVTKKEWEKIPADVRDACLAAARQAGAKLQADVRKGGVDSVKAMQDHKLRVVAVPDDAVAQWRAAAENIYPKLRGRFVPGDVFDEAQRLVAEFRAKGGQSGH